MTSEIHSSRPQKVVSFQKIISLVIYILRGCVRTYMKGNEMLFEIIYIICGLVGVVSVLYR